MIVDRRARGLTFCSLKHLPAERFGGLGSAGAGTRALRFGTVCLNFAARVRFNGLAMCVLPKRFGAVYLPKTGSKMFAKIKPAAEQNSNNK